MTGELFPVSRDIRMGLFFPVIYVDKTDLCSVANELQHAAQIEFPHNIGAVVFNCFGADERFVRHLI